MRDIYKLTWNAHGRDEDPISAGLMLRGAILGLAAVLGSGLVASAETVGATLTTAASTEYLAYVGTDEGDSVTGAGFANNATVSLAGISLAWG